MNIDRRSKVFYNRLFKEGYYIRPCKFANTTHYEIVKDLHPEKPTTGSRMFHGAVNKRTALILNKEFGFVIRNRPVLYFGKAETIPNNMILQ